MLQIARRKVPKAQFLPLDLMRPLPFPDSSFDKVNCAQTLKHLPTLAGPFREFARVLRPSGLFVFSVTHPDMDWTDYEMRANPAFILSAEADIHHHDWPTYERALHDGGFVELQRQVVQVSEAISHLLTPNSFDLVVGRSQILVCSARAAA